jgi:hypothetical protein
VVIVLRYGLTAISELEYHALESKGDRRNVEQQQTALSTAAQDEALATQKLPYAQPETKFVPVELEERLSKDRKKGSFSVPLGCC